MADRTDDQWTTGDRPLQRESMTRESMTRESMTASPDDPDAIRAEINDTRSRMSDTLDELGERLNPNVVKERVKESIREATIGRVEHMARNAADRVNETRHTIVDTIRENPIPAAMVGIGLGWLLLNSRRGDSGPVADHHLYEGQDWDADDAGYRDRDSAGKLDRIRGQASELADTVKEKAGDLAHRAQDAAGQVKDRAQEVAGRVSERTQEMAGRVNERAHEVASTVAQRSRQQARRVEDMYYESPLAIGAVTLAAGFAVGLGVPRTRAESRLMGETRDQLVEKVRDVALDKSEKVQHVAERVIQEGKESVKEAARSEGLISR